ncbi:methyl-accepting chemotaxis protein [Paenibacillus sambharensis]|uniref:Methyl-accepting chemotaxis protein n=1 Tax=Paenibacillus sambharensis TaxID=1803190 RepID=A0A2W1L589_9BACL|nr:methyl-accepting chemotaxis protein [Paenibacillus sambharensis]PZD94093.1 methyl-accepting chemotaxis protein [Paenibacillus sambharensis]
MKRKPTTKQTSGKGKIGITRSLTGKILFCILLILLMACSAFAISGTLINKELSGKLLEQFDRRLETNITIAQQSLRQVPLYNVPIQAHNDARYNAIKKVLESLQETHGLESVYILSNHSGTERIDVLTGLPEDFGTAYEFTPEMHEAMQNDTATTSDVYSDEFGTHKSVFAPMKNVQGEAYGILGIDLDASAIPEAAKQVQFTTILITVIVAVLGIGIALILGRIVTRPIRILMDATEKVAAGDLSETFEMKRKDELGRLAASFKVMGHNLQGLIHQIASMSQEMSATSRMLHHNAQGTSESSDEVAQSMNKLSDGLTHIVDSISSSTSTISDIDSELAVVTAEVGSMREISHQVKGQSEEGQKLVEQTLQQMETIRDVMLHSREAAQKLGDRSREIGEIIGIISGISQQTNLLALNAAIEAARVGEQGKGFAVVAGEVRKLAEQSAEAALSITELISSTQENSNLVIERVAEGYQAVEQGHGWITGTYANFREIQNGIMNYSERTDHLLETLVGFERSFAKIADAMQQISGVTQEQAAGFEEVAAASEEQSASVQEVTGTIGRLSELSEELQKSIDKFKI